MDFARPAGQRWRTQFWLPWDLNDQQLYVVEPGGGTFAAKADHGAGYAPFSLALGALRGDGAPIDLVIANAVSDTVGVLLNRCN